MEAKEAIEVLENASLPYEALMNDEVHERYNDAFQTILSLAERMAMYEWWWELSLAQMVEHGIRDMYALEDGNCQLGKDEEARVMKAWKENT